MEHGAKRVESGVEIWGSVSTFIDPSPPTFLPCLLLSHLILWDNSGNISIFKLGAGTVWPAQLTLLSE